MKEGLTAGYSGTPLAKKLGIKPGYHISLIGEPEDYIGLLRDLPDNIHWHRNFDNADMDMIHIFVISGSLLQDVITRSKNLIKKSGSIWVSWPKRSSMLPTDVNENIIRNVALDMGLVDVKVCAIDNTWSGLKLVYRLKDR